MPFSGNRQEEEASWEGGEGGAQTDQETTGSLTCSATEGEGNQTQT